VSNLNAQLSGANLQLIDNVLAIQRVNSPIATIVAQTAVAYYDPYYLVNTPTIVTVNMPATVVWVLSIKNLSGTNTISIQLTPQGGSAWTSPYVLVPNGLFLTMATFSSNPGSGGFSGIAIGASGVNTYAEILMSA
jgi:hypothetical protein